MSGCSAWWHGLLAAGSVAGLRLPRNLLLASGPALAHHPEPHLPGRYLMLEFPALAVEDPQQHFVEIGCGCGSGVHSRPEGGVSPCLHQLLGKCE